MKKVWRYISKYKKLLTISIFAMLVVQSLGLVAPLIVKSILDDYLVGIERPWYEVSTENDQTVNYRDKIYSQEGTNDLGISIVIYRGKYYFVDEIVENGNIEITGSTLQITMQD